MGLNHDKARAYGIHGPDVFVGTRVAIPTSKQPGTGIAEYAPEYWWSDSVMQEFGHSSDEILENVIEPSFQRQLNQVVSEVPLHAGQNAHLRYNAGASAIAQQRMFEVYLSIEGGDAEQLTTDGFFAGQPVYFSFDDDVLKYIEAQEEQRVIDQELRIQKQDEIDDLPMIPNDRGIVIPRTNK